MTAPWQATHSPRVQRQLLQHNIMLHGGFGAGQVSGVLPGAAGGRTVKVESYSVNSAFRILGLPKFGSVEANGTLLQLSLPNGVYVQGVTSAEM
jgi:hypothetical protein